MKPQPGPRIEDWDDECDIHESARRAKERIWRWDDSRLDMDAIEEDEGVWP